MMTPNLGHILFTYRRQIELTFSGEANTGGEMPLAGTDFRVLAAHPAQAVASRHPGLDL